LCQKQDYFSCLYCIYLLKVYPRNYEDCYTVLLLGPRTVLRNIKVKHQHCHDDHVVKTKLYYSQSTKNIRTIILYFMQEHGQMECQNAWYTYSTYNQEASHKSMRLFVHYFFTWQDSSAGVMLGKLVLPGYEKILYHYITKGFISRYITIWMCYYKV